MTAITIRKTISIITMIALSALTAPVIYAKTSPPTKRFCIRTTSHLEYQSRIKILWEL